MLSAHLVAFPVLFCRQLSQLGDIARKINLEKKASESRSGGASPEDGAFDGLFSGLSSAYGRSQQEFLNRGITNPSYDQQCGVTADNFSEFEFDDASQLNSIRASMPNPSNRRSDGSRVTPPVAGQGQRFYSNGLGRQGTQMQMNSSARVGGASTGGGTRGAGGTAGGAGGMAIQASAGAGTGTMAPPHHQPHPHVQQQPQPHVQQQPQPHVQQQPQLHQQIQNSTPSQGRARRMLKHAKKQMKDPKATDDEKRIAGRVKRDLNNRQGLAYAVAKDADENEEDEKESSQDWFVEAAGDYLAEEKEEERRKSG